MILSLVQFTALAQTVTAVATNATCPDEGKITATANGFTGAIGYQLKKNDVVIRPIGGSGFQSSNVFENLPAGVYEVLADDGTVSASATNITVAVNYTTITASVSPAVVNCGTSTSSLTVSATGGSGNYLYAITPTSEVNAPPIGSFQPSATFTGLAVGSYKFWVKDNICSSATLVNTTGSVNSVLAPNAGDYGLPSSNGRLAFATANNHLSGYRVNLERFVRGQLTMSAADAASFTVEIFNSGASVAGPVQVPANGGMNIPVPNGLVNATLTAVLKNTCNGSTKTFNIVVQGPEMSLLASCPGPQAMYRLMNTSIVSLPATITYTNQDGTGNGNQTIVRTVANNEHIYVNFPPNSIFNWKVVDQSGAEWNGVHNFTTDLIAAPTQWTSYIDNCTPNRGTIELVMRGVRNSTPISYQILSAPAGSESLIGYVGTTNPGWKNDYTLVLNGQTYFPRGTYRIKFIDAGCHNGREMNVTAQGRVADVPVSSAVQTTANCGSFNFKLNGTYDASFQQVIVSGPTGTAGLIRSNTQSFTNMPYGTYKIALRVAGISCNLFEREFTYSAESSIEFDALNSGGFTCTSGGTGDLIIAASTTIPNAILEYSINGGANWQTSNIFTSLTEGSYSVIIRENICGNQRTVNASVSSNIQATINNQNTQSLLCVGSNAVLNVNAIGGTSYTWTYPDGSIHTGKVQNLTNITPAMAGIYSVVVQSASCTSAPQEVVLKVNTKPTIDAVPAQIACRGVVTTINFAGVQGREYTTATAFTNLTTVYNWTNSNTAIGLPASGTGNISFTPTNTGNTPLIANISVTAQGAAGCATTAINFSITINPDTKIALSSAAGTNAQEKCINEAVTNISYAVTHGTGATVTGLPAGLTGVYDAGVFTISGTATEAGTFNYTVSATGACASATATGTIKVNPNVAIALSSAAGTNAQEKCINEAVTNISYAVTHGTGATVTGLPAGLTGVYDAGVFTISGTATEAGTFNYTVSATGACASATATGTIKINPNVAIALSSATGTNAQEKCINEAVTNISYAVTNGTGATVTGLPAGLTGVYDAGVFTISGTATEAGTFNYTVSATGACASATANGTIKISPNVAIALSSSAGTNAQEKCINEAVTNISYAVTNGTGATVTGLPAGLTGVYDAGVFTISGTATEAGTFSYTVSATGACASATANGTIKISPNVEMSLSSASSTTTQSVNINSAIIDVVYTLTNGATGATVTGLPTGVIGTYSAGVFTISGTPSVAGTFNYTVTSAGGCGAVTLNGQIIINANASIVLSSAVGTDKQTLCVNTSLVTIDYAITNGTNATVTGLPAGVSGVYTTGNFRITGTPTVPGTFSYTITVTGAGAAATATGTITVTPNATITLASATGTNVQNRCIGTAITNIGYAVANATGASVTGLPAGLTGTYNAGVFTISGTPTASGTFNYTITTAGDCSSATATGTITVTPNATITLASATGTNAQTRCIGTAITNIGYAVANATGASVTGLPAGLTGTYNAGVFTISGTPTASGTFNYTITTAGDCSSATATGTITVTPNATITLASATGTNAQTKCIGTAITNIGYAVANATGASVTGLPAGLTGTYNAGVFTISGTPTASGTFNYTITTAGECSSATATGSIVVNPNAVLSLSSATATSQQSICVSSSILNITYAATNATSVTVSGLPTGVSGRYSNGIFTITGSPTITGLFNYTVTALGSCASATLNGSITVNELPVATITSSLGTTISKGDVTVLTATGGTIYTWTGADILGSSNNSSLEVRPRQTTTYTVKVTNASGCTSEKTITINVNEDLKLIPNNIITPNGDGKNDFWVIKNIDYYPNNKVSVFDRAGRKVYASSSYKNDWDGSYQGAPLAEAAYFYVIDMGNGYGLIRGTINIIRDKR